MNNTKNALKPSHLLWIGALTVLLLPACESTSSGGDLYADVPAEHIEKGKMLAEQYCKRCHELPDPAQLDAATWETHALPAMGPLLGIFQYKQQTYPYRGDPDMRGPGYLASNPVVTPEEWQYIVDYYTASAPDQLPEQDRSEKISMVLPMFELLTPDLDYKDTHSSFVSIQPQRTAPLVVSDARTHMTYFLDRDLQSVDSLQTSGPLVHIEFSNDGSVTASNVGRMEPNDGANGSAVTLQQVSGKWEVTDEKLLEGLHRPMQVLPADLNQDGATDYLICEFGYMQGGLIWMENRGQEGYQKHTISSLPGALKAYPGDFDQDGDIDIMAMFAQGEEGIYLFTNQGDGSFENRELLRFPALYGSSHFEPADFNGDGRMDILYTAGDNADYTSVLKPYHGVYIFLNNGEDGFEQSYFFPIHGCYKAMARDFDGDGDLDIATIAHYADFTSQPEEGFVYLENRGMLHFSPYSMAELTMGRWISMDVGDMNLDGRPDVILGNFVQPSNFSNPAINWATAPPMVVLKNVGL